MIDRFGLLPDQVKNLFRQTSLKLKISPLGIAKVTAGDQSGSIEFSADTKIDPFNLIKLVQSKPATFKLEGGHTLKFVLNMASIDQRFSRSEEHTSELQSRPHLVCRLLL